MATATLTRKSATSVKRRAKKGGKDLSASFNKFKNFTESFTPAFRSAGGITGIMIRVTGKKRRLRPTYGKFLTQ